MLEDVNFQYEQVTNQHLFGLSLPLQVPHRRCQQTLVMLLDLNKHNFLQH